MSTVGISNFKGKRPVIGDRVYVDSFARVIGDVIIGDDCSIWPMAVLRGDMHSIEVGNRTNIQDGSILHVTHAGWNNPEGFPLKIGDDVTVGHNAVLHACQVGDLCLIGMGTIILDGAVLESGVIVGAGSLVTPGKRLESGYLYHGSPATKSRELSDREKEFLLYSAGHYVNYKNEYLLREV